MNWLDIVVVIILILALVKGFSSGLVKQLASLAGLILGAVFAGQVASLISPYVLQFTNASESTIKPLSYFFAFLLIIIFFFVLGRVVQSFLEAIKINSLNRIAGAAFAVAKWLVIISIMINLLAELDSKERILKKDVRQKSVSYSYIKAITPRFIPFLDFRKQDEG